MAIFITEDMIEQAILQKLGKPEIGYDVIVCDFDPTNLFDFDCLR